MLNMAFNSNQCVFDESLISWVKARAAEAYATLGAPSTLLGPGSQEPGSVPIDSEHSSFEAWSAAVDALLDHQKLS